MNDEHDTVMNNLRQAWSLHPQPGVSRRTPPQAQWPNDERERRRQRILRKIRQDEEREIQRLLRNRYYESE